ncbi:DNA cytosine methyltransferase [Tissierella sp. MSJ-40]|uniref:DNA (cytosine-5-)-methyltransferase n=1 Tax=Tissierella simiarum TaxID=2841534 RepID=A0ABS6EBT3_9FIRM|nr:DNA cytosine methyltransferase [Tissierella simiarum]
MKFIDLFAGIGGFRTGMEMAGHECVGWCEIDKFAQKSYRAIYDTEGEWFSNDIRTVNPRDIPEFDCITGGFPCQSFSVAGKRGGFEDTRGTLFFEIARIIRERQPKLVFLENVKGLLNHDGGRTFGTILNTFWELGYDVEWQLLNSKDFGVPQNRERVFIIGYPRGTSRQKIFPIRRARQVNSDSQLYKQAGNSVTVNVIYEIARRI